jgi:hypothetical protein
MEHVIRGRGRLARFTNFKLNFQYLPTVFYLLPSMSHLLLIQFHLDL